MTFIFSVRTFFQPSSGADGAFSWLCAVGAVCHLWSELLLTAQHKTQPDASWPGERSAESSSWGSQFQSPQPSNIFKVSCVLHRSTHGLLLLKVYLQFSNVVSSRVRREGKVHLCQKDSWFCSFYGLNILVKSHQESDSQLWEVHRVPFQSVKQLIYIRWGSDLNLFPLWCNSSWAAFLSSMESYDCSTKDVIKNLP